MNVRLRRLYGPSLWADFAAVLAEFDRSHSATLPAEIIAARWLQLDSKPLWTCSPPQVNLSLLELVALIAVELQHPSDPENARVAILPHGEDRGPCLVLGYLDYQASCKALRVAVGAAVSIFRAADDIPAMAARLMRARQALHECLPQNPLMFSLIREATAIGIPVASIARNSRVFLFGQGARGIHFHQAATDGDSLTGTRLVMNKAWSNQLVIRLGFPGMTHAVAGDVSQATKIAREIGYPVVVKPVDGRKGNGVAAYVLDDQELAQAYSAAASSSKAGVIVERYVAGEDHRLTVFCGKLAWVVSRRPARVIGDGRRTVEELIAAENERRQLDPNATANGLSDIRVGQDELIHLRKQGYSLQSCPPEGVRVDISSVSNVSRGGTWHDVSDGIHPDNRDMAECIARSFRLDSVGIDFQTPDISRSWRDVACGVIEVNTTPGLVMDARLQVLLRAKFPGDSDGRIPSLLLIDPPAGLCALLSDAIAAMGLCVGATDSASTALGGMPRCGPDVDLAARVMALIADPACEVLVIETTASAIEDAGLVLDRVDLVVASARLQDDLDRLLRSCSSQLIVCDPLTSAEQLLPTLLDAPLLADLAAQPGAGQPGGRRGSRR